jgi:hypothetical protein
MATRMNSIVSPQQRITIWRKAVIVLASTVNCMTQFGDGATRLAVLRWNGMACMSTP